MCEEFPQFIQFKSLQVLCLIRLDKLQTLCCKEVRQGKEQTFHLLQNVVIKSCPKFLTLIPDMASVTFPSLKKIKLHDLEALERWVATGGRQENEPVFPLLEKVEIEKCPKLQTLCCEMAFTPFPALKKIKLYDLEGLERLVENESTFPLLEKADIRNCPKLRSLPEAPKLKIFSLNENKAELSLFLLQSSYMSSLSKPVTCPHYPSRGVVLTKDNLIKRKWQGNKNCCFCCNDETIRHLFFECRFALSVWSIIQAASGLPPPHCVAHMFGSWLDGIHNNLKSHVLLGAAATCWSLWLYRNNVVFDKKVISSHLQVIYSLIHWLRIWAILQKPDSRDMVVAACQHLEKVVKEFFTQGYGW